MTTPINLPPVLAGPPIVARNLPELNSPQGLAAQAAIDAGGELTPAAMGKKPADVSVLRRIASLLPPLPEIPLPAGVHVVRPPVVIREPVTCAACGCTTERRPGTCHSCGELNYRATPWFTVSMDGWHSPAHDGYYEWLRAGDGEIEMLWWDSKNHRLNAVAGHCPPLVWRAWRGVEYGTN